MSYRAKAWAVVGIVVLLADLFAPPGQTLSEAVDDALEHPVGEILVPLAIYHVADHLTNRLDPRFDLLHHGFGLLRLCFKRG